MAGKVAAKEQRAGGSASGPKGLTPAQIRQFKEEGLLIVRQMLPHEALQPLIDELTQKVDQAIGEATRQGLLDAKNTFDEAPFASRLALASAACSGPELAVGKLFFTGETDFGRHVYLAHDAGATGRDGGIDRA